MIVGNGIIAQTLTNFKDNPDVIIFASGVSNSKETDNKAFSREKSMLFSQDTSKILVYFSTCSIYDTSVQNTPYVRHKIAMENTIKVTFPNFRIIRLPTVVSNSSNPYTLVNNIKNSIDKNEEVTVFRNASRYLLDVDDLKILIPLIINTNVTRYEVNVTYCNVTTVMSIVEMISSILNKDVTIRLKNNGNFFHINNMNFKELLLQNNINIYNENYNYNCIKKYINDKD